MAFLDRSELSAAATLATTNEMLIWQGSNVGKTVTAARLFAELGMWRVLAASGAAASLANPGHTNETTLATINVPAGLMQANGALRVWSLWTVTSSANNKTIRYRLGGAAGAQCLACVLTTSIGFNAARIIHNRNAQNSQVTYVPSTTNAFNSNAGANSFSAIDMSASQDLLLTAQLALGTETATLEAYIVEVLSKA